MGDRHKSETQKPVKNTLLSGASHGFPFESFQGNSMLIPVSQDSPSVLTDSVDTLNPVKNESRSNSANVSQLIENVAATSIDDKPKEEKLTSPQQSTGQSYASGIFNSLFGGANQGKKELDLGQKNIDQVPTLSSESPLLPPNVQVCQPALQAPAANNLVQRPLGFVHSSNSPFQQPAGWTPKHEDTNVSPSDPSIQNIPFFQTIATEKEPVSWQTQNFFKTDSKPEFNEQTSSKSIGFEFYSDSKSVQDSPLHAISREQTSSELNADSSNFTTNVPFFNLNQPESGGIDTHLQTQPCNEDSFRPIHPPPAGVPPTPNTQSSSSAPPMSIGNSRNYRRDHHKRPAYAPVPGLTSNTAVSSSYLMPTENFINYSSSSFPALNSTETRHPLVSSVSQPVFNLSRVGSNVPPMANYPSTLANSLHNLYDVNYSNSDTSSFQTENNSTETFSNSIPMSSSSDLEPQGYSAYPSSSSINFTAGANQTFTYSNTPVTASGFVPVHPTVMSIKEQPTADVASPTVPVVPSPPIIPTSFNNLANLGHSGIIYRPAYYHWFLKIETKDGKDIWQPFSMTDSLALEHSFNSGNTVPGTIVSTDGGRYDVNITNRTRTAVYWQENPKKVMRCSWFFKSTTESRLHPYEEDLANLLEEEYKKAVTSNSWNRKVDLPSGDYVIMYGPSSMALFQCAPQTPEGWEAETDPNIHSNSGSLQSSPTPGPSEIDKKHGNTQVASDRDFAENTSHRPKIVKRGVLDDFEIDEGEAPIIDHLVFVVHGIGSVCDFKFRTIEEAGDLNDSLDAIQLTQRRIWQVDGFRSKSLQLIKSHFRTSLEQGLVNRIEVLPVSWHGHLHGETTGVDKKLQTITLKSIPRLRHFTNDTLLDILFYTSPIYCENIMQQVGREINTLFAKFKSRNPNFNGGVSLVGHSLGSLILFDMLCHQKPISPRLEDIKENSNQTKVCDEVQPSISTEKTKPSLSRKVSYVIGRAGTGQPYIEYPQLSFTPVAFFAMGSPIGMFVTVRGIDSLGINFTLPTCSRFFNIFHPFDPVAYRIEALINPELSEKRPVLIPHHKGRKRMHLELKETMARVGADLKQRLIDSVRSTWNTVYQLTMFGRADDGLEQEVDKVIEKQLERQQTETVSQLLSESYDTEFNAGQLNMGRRIDYVLQEAPLESFNEYVSALTSHVIYWDSEDTMLLILKEVYGSMGISPDNQQAVVPGAREDIPSPSTPFFSSSDPSTKSSSLASYSMYGFK